MDIVYGHGHDKERSCDKGEVWTTDVQLFYSVPDKESLF